MNLPFVLRSTMDAELRRKDDLLARRVSSDVHERTVARLEAVTEERDRLREANDRLTEHLVRIQRVQSGMAEAPKPAKPAPEPMPEEFAEWIRGWAGASIQRDIRNRAFRAHAAGKAWADIIRDEKSAMEEPG